MQFDLDKIKKEVIYTIRYTHSDTPIEGNASAYGDEELDNKAAQYIYAELDSGNLWAWCDVTVRAHFGALMGEDHLGCCSYKSQDDFESGDYFEDMKNQAFDDLMAQLTELNNKLNEISKEGER